MSTHIATAALTGATDQHRTITPARSSGRRWLTTAGWAAAAQVVVALLILKLHVATHPDTAVGARGMLLGIGTALFAVALVTIIAGLCVRPLLDLLTEMRRDRRGSAEVAQLRGEIAALRGEQAAVREEMQRLVATIAVCGTKLAGLPEDVAEQIRPLTERVEALEAVNHAPDHNADQYLAGYADGLAAREIGTNVVPINGYSGNGQR